jgi:hypothetical protein
MTVREMRAVIRKLEAALRPWMTVGERERVALQREAWERGIEHVKSLKGGK